MSTVTYRHENSFHSKKEELNIESKKALLTEKKDYPFITSTKLVKTIKILLVSQ